MNTNGIYHEVNRIYHVYEKYHMNVGYMKIMRFDFDVNCRMKLNTKTK